MLSDSGDELTGPALPTEPPKGPCRSSRWAKGGDGSRGHGGQALVTITGCFKNFSFHSLGVEGEP